MGNFLFCSIYLLAMTQESEIILATCHKTPKSQIYYIDVVFIKDHNENEVKFLCITEIFQTSIKNKYLIYCKLK